MKTTSILGAVLASAAVASAQVKYEDGKYICEQENAAYCAGDSMGTDIIIRCNGKVGQPGRCTNNLAGQPPLGVKPALCWQTSPTSGDAACEKNCVVYGSSGNYNGTFTLPADACTPTYTAISSSSATVPPSSLSSLTGVPTLTEETTLTTTICPSTTEAISPSSDKPQPPYSLGNSTVTTAMTNPPLTRTTALTNPALTTSTTALTNPPVGAPNATRTGGGPIPTGAAASNQAAGALVVLGGMMAFLL
ncbi:hypothetical protein C8A00DRAFT_14905 [Chaetomidium leptoderma]|uniref:Uncharacterized protein n=1 Tax=Chaetomidium leptoderma TaxID=669021 RepID=A0AAN6VMJ2_9PEZI|nr:hypothetical protein C8A00DRAFT_14905 [Chaetomidium leptoderma]